MKPLLSRGLESVDPAAEWFHNRVPMSDEDWRSLTRAARRRGFHVAGVAQLRLVADVWEAVDRAIEEGTTLDEFKRQVGASLQATWGRRAPHRLQNIFRTNVQRAYMAGRVKEMDEPEVRALRPFRRFDTAEDEDVCPICAPLDGTILPADDPWWDGHTPPLHFQDRCGIVSLAADDVDPKDVGPPDIPARPALQGFGDYPVANDWENPDPLSGYPPDLVEILEGRPQEIGPED